MARTPVEKYIWLIDILRQRGRMTRRLLNDAWVNSSLNTSGNELCRRTLYNYKNAILELFDIEICYDPVTFEYFIKESDKSSGKLTEWLLNSSAVSEVLSESRDISDRIVLEDIPSARLYLPVVIKALRGSTRLKFDYHNYTRSRPTRGVIFEPYMARIFKQRWYVIGLNVNENKIKTYALDRMSNTIDMGTAFEKPDYFEPSEYFNYSFGIVVNRSSPVDIVLRTDHHYANYLAALPLHHSQQQTVHDHYCLFRYRMQITDDLVQELLSHGSRVVIEQPAELRLRIKEELKKSLAEYECVPVYASTTKKSGSLPVTDMESVELTVNSRTNRNERKSKKCKA